MESTRVILIGNYRHTEFEDAVQSLRAYTDLELAETVDIAVERSGAASKAWHVVVLAQTCPGQFGARDVERIAQAMPLARLIGLLGSWCEGDARSGHPWPGVLRIYWHQWAARFTPPLQAGRWPAAWELPRTASPVEHVLHQAARPLPQSTGLVAVITRRSLLYHGVATASAQAGYATVWLPQHDSHTISGAAAVVWDGYATRGQTIEQLEHIATGFAPIPVIALLGFPRVEDIERAKQTGATAVVSVPFQLGDLWNALHQAIVGESTHR